MDNRLLDILNDREDNYLSPFYSLKSNEDISKQIESIYKIGCKAVCIKPDFNIFADEKEQLDRLRNLFEECKNRGMKVWLFDENGEISGSADDVVKAHPEFRKKHLLERHFDLIGPMKSASVIINKFEKDDEVLGAYLFKRVEADESLTDEFIDLSENIAGDFINFDVPKGVYRLFIYFKSNYKSDNLIDLLNPKATDMMIKNIYQPFFDNLGEFFGDTLVGFVSDKVGFYNDYFSGFDGKNRFKTVGQSGLCLPVSDDLLRLMSKKANENVVPFLAGLWYDIEGKSSELRHNYMNTVSKFFSRYFTQKIGRWCASHGVEYITYSADNNSHSKLGKSTAHYFRSQHGQSLSTVNVGAQQVLPGFAHYSNASFDENGAEIDSDFVHYTLAKLASSDTHFDTDKKGRAVAKLFKNGGFAQSCTTKKWIVDFLSVRGINCFCPEEMSFDESDPQYESYRFLMRYVNKTAHILSGGTHTAKALVLYNADCEWGSANDFIHSGKICKELYDSHIDYDIITFDYLKKAEILNHKLVLNGEKYDVLFVPYSSYIYGKNLNVLRNLETIGFDVVFVGGLPKNCESKFKNISLGECSRYYDKNCDIDLIVTGEADLLRHYHIKRGNADIYMFFNESVTSEVDATVYFGRDAYIKLDLASDSVLKGKTQSGKLNLKLSPYQSEIYVFDDFDEDFLQNFKTESDLEFERYLNIPFDVSISEKSPYNEFEFLTVVDRPININSSEFKPDFSGKIKYAGKFYLEKRGDYLIDLKDVGETAEVFVNGKFVGLRVAKPFVFDISEYTVDGENLIEIIVANTLAPRLKDEFSKFSVLSASGLREQIVMYKKK